MIPKALKNYFKKLHGGSTNLMIAVETETLPNIEKMIRACEAHEEFFRTDKKGRTVLFYAAARGDEEILWALLRRLPGTGMSSARVSLIDHRDDNGDRAEDVAAAQGHEEASELLSHERIRIEYYE
jgi:hypothetical protein